MAANHRLTALIRGRTITGMQSSGDTAVITFADGSTMTVKVSGSPHTAAAGGTIAGVRQAGTELDLDFEDGTTLTIQLAEATSSVMVRDKAGVMEYAD